MSKVVMSAGIAQAKKEGQFLLWMLCFLLLAGTLVIPPIQNACARYGQEQSATGVAALFCPKIVDPKQQGSHQ